MMKNQHTSPFWSLIRIAFLSMSCLFWAFSPPSVEREPSMRLISNIAPDCEYKEEDFEDFESGWGIWNDGGKDAFLEYSPFFSSSGSFSVLLRDNDVSSHITTDEFDLSRAQSVKISFSYLVRAFEKGEDFWLQMSLDGGESYHTLQTWSLGKEFWNDERHQEEVTLAGPFSDQTRFRFRCDASWKRDYLYLDDIALAICEAESIERAFQGEGACAATGNLLMEAWLGIGESHSVADIPTDQAPSYTQLLPQFEIPINAHEAYGVRLRGYICPPQTGLYTFWISSDDNGELWLSSDSSPQNKERIAYVPGWTEPQVWGRYPEQQSREIYLEAGRSYYVEALMKEGIGGDNLAVKWLKPNGSYDHPIPGAYLSPYEEKDLQDANCSATGELFMESWLDIGDSHSVADIPTEQVPSYTQMLSHFEIPINVHEAYGVRVRGYICPPASGSYTFWLASDDNGELWLSTNRNPLNKRRIAHVPGWTHSREWGKYPEQQSQEIYLEAGNAYYVEALMKEGGGGDHLAVKWQKPDKSFDEPIPGSYLSPYVEENEPRLIIEYKDQQEEELCVGGGERVYHFQDDFESGTAGLSYKDDPFQGTQAPFYSQGQWANGVGPSGGHSLGIYLGGRDNQTVWGMSGGWYHTIDLEVEAEVKLSFWYKLVQASDYEEDEYSEVIFSVDGQESSLARIGGNGNGGYARTTGWKEVKRSLGRLSPGRHEVVLGAYNNKKTYHNELTQVYFDILEIEAHAVGNTAPNAEFTLSRNSVQTPVQVSVNASGSSDKDGDVLGYSWDFGDGTQKKGIEVEHAYKKAGSYFITLTVVDDKGCESTLQKSLLVEEPTKSFIPLQVEVTPIQPSACGELGEVRISTNRGTVEVRKGDEIIQNLDQLLPGRYTWKLTDGEDEETGAFSITSAYLDPVISAVNVSEPTCKGPDGEIAIEFETNVDRASISFSLDGGQSYPLKVATSEKQAMFQELPAGTYDLWVRWGNGECAQAVQKVALNNPQAPEVSIAPLDPMEENAGFQKLTATPTGGTWSGPVSADGVFDPAQGAGFYTIGYTYEDNKGCVGTGEIQVEVLPVRVVDTRQAQIDLLAPLAPSQSLIQLTASPTGGSWSGDVTPSGIFDPGCPGLYTVIYNYQGGADCQSADTAKIWVKPEPMDIFIIAGQSNAVGAKNTLNVLSFAPEQEDSFVKYAWNIPGETSSNAWESMQLIDMGEGLYGHGGELPFSRQMMQLGYSNMGIIKFAKGGTNLDTDWDPNVVPSAGGEGDKSAMFSKMKTFVNARLAELEQQSIPYRISGFFWHQGEGDMNAARAPRYQANLEEFVGKVREEFGSELPFFLASVYNPNSSPAEEEAVQLAQQEVAKSDPQVYLMDLDTVYYNQNNLPNVANLVSDLLHFNSQGLAKVGQTYAQSYLQAFPIEGCSQVPGELCESLENLALGKATAQSSTYGLGTSDIAVDGITEGSSPWNPDLAHTEVEFQPWWQVDLGSQSSIEQIKIHNRTDCCFGRLNNFSVFVSQIPFPEDATLSSLKNDPNIFHVTFSGSAGLTELISLGSKGRYVRIQHSREIQLHIAEIEVWGCTELSQASRFKNVNEAIGGEEDLEKNRLKVFPNPTAKVLIVQVLEPDPNKQVEMVLYNLAGQRVKRLRNREGIISVDVSQLARGIYSIQVNGENWSALKRIQVE